MTTHCPVATQQVIWLSYDAKVMPHLIAESGCVMFPSEKTPLHEAKCSVKLATTLLQGAPIVASAVGEQAYYGAAGAAHLVAADATPAEFAAAVAQVLADPGRQAALRQQGQQRLLATYDWAQLGAKLEQFYAEMMR
jgi:glycosyltransferase involved in cell wall biosynthesis